MMKHLNKLWDANELEDNASLWFKTPKPNEELYNLENDPYELKNLVSKVELQDTLAFLRKRLDRWIIETEDLGEFPEIELIKKWFPEGKPQKLSPLLNKVEAGKISLNHPDKGITIVWKKAQDSVWSVYSKPLDISKFIQAKAVKIGYNDSPIFTLD
mgnify:CR=1 FL=1